MKIEVLALRAKKDDPENEGNKIAFTMDGHLCGIFSNSAHQIIRRAYFDLEMRYQPPITDRYARQDFIFSNVSKQIATRNDLLEIAKRV